jgi:dipeptidyl aminopeptidase/acylaminoacyl peptidase
MNKRLCPFTLLIFLSGIASPTFSQTGPFTIHDYFRLKTVAEAAISPDGKMIAYSMNLNRPMEEGKGSDYRELYLKNLDDDSVIPCITGANYLTNIQWTPDSQTITFLAKFGEDQENQVYGFDVGGAGYRKISNIPTGINNYLWNPGGNGFLFTSSEKPKGISDNLKKIGFDAEIYEENIPAVNLYYHDGATIKKITREGSVFSFAFSPDGMKIAVQVAPENLVDHSYMFKRIYLIDILTGIREKWVDNPGKLTEMSWSPDSKRLAFIAGSDINDPVSGSLFVVEAGRSKNWKDLENLTLDLEVSDISVKWKDNQTLLVVSEVGTEVALSEVNMRTGKRTSLLEGGSLVFSQVELAGNIVCMVGNMPGHPDELYILDPESAKLRRLTNSNPWLIERTLGTQEKISYTARDGIRIEGVLIYPVGDIKPENLPLICYIHGGPESCVKNGWNASYSNWGQIAACQGYAVFMPNYRSSSGRGVTFSKMDQTDLGDEEFLDVLDGVEFLARQGIIDKKKVGIGGGSYGGYLSALGATKFSDHFMAAVVFVGISNQLSKTNLSDIPWEEYYVHWKLWPNDNPELFYDRSAVKYSSNNKTATLILHGKEDSRVHPSQSLELYRQLKLFGKAPVRLIWYPGEGHGNRNNQAQLDFGLRTMQWFNYYLKGEGEPEKMPESTISYELEKLK